MITTRGAGPPCMLPSWARRTLTPMTPSTEITLVDGARLRIEGDAEAVERIILDAARGSLMELAWLTEVDTGQRLGVNPECVVMLRASSA